MERIQFEVLRKQQLSLRFHYEEAHELAIKLRMLMASDEIFNAIQKVHRFGGKSHEIQAVLRTDLESLGFRAERKGLFSQYEVSGLRPDFYRPLAESGIIVEVERGKAITNNMDLLDLWKCHLCDRADFLFLVLPLARVSADGKPIKAFDSAKRRLATFFQPRNYVNVEAAFLFGY
jgi:hypothetical protein